MSDHCWHSPSVNQSLSSYPPTYHVRCCRCGMWGTRREVEQRVAGHGPYFTERVLGPVLPNSVGPCVAGEITGEQP